MDASVTRAPLRAPFTVCMWLTDYCNLDCAYCYAKPFSGGVMDPDRAQELVDEFVRLGVFDLTLAGGEPTLHPAWLDIVRRAVQGGIRVGLLSNGVLITDDEIRELERATNHKNFILQISIDSADPAINDISRGKTARVLRTIERLKQSSIELQLATVVNKSNIDTAHSIIDRYYPDIKRFHFLNIQRTASALAHPELLLGEEETLAFWMRLNEYKDQFPEDLFLPSLRVQLRAMGNASVDTESALHSEASWDVHACSAGWTHVNVTSKLDVLGCDIAKEHTWMGNCLDQSFATVWNSRQAEQVRNAKYPACYNIAAPSGARLSDDLKETFVPVANLVASLKQGRTRWARQS